MKRLLITGFVCTLLTVPAMAVSSLGDWPIGTPGSIHLVWDFSSKVKPSGDGFVADPQVADVYGTGVHVPTGGAVGQATISSTPGDAVVTFAAGEFTNIDTINVALTIYNFEISSAVKEIWVKIEGEGDVTPIALKATDGGSTDFSYEFLPATGAATFGAIIKPNPFFEEIDFAIDPAAAESLASLTSITVDTICRGTAIPAPAALLLATLGVSAVGWLRTKRYI